MKRLENIGNQIIALEKKCAEGINVYQNMQEINKLIEGLSIEELLFIDEYILESTKLKK